MAKRSTLVSTEGIKTIAILTVIVAYTIAIESRVSVAREEANYEVSGQPTIDNPQAFDWINTRPDGLDDEMVLAVSKGQTRYLTFYLPGGTQSIGKIEKTFIRSLHDYTVYGTLDGHPFDQFIVAVLDDIVLGSIRTHDWKRYEISINGGSGYKMPPPNEEIEPFHCSACESRLKTPPLEISDSRQYIRRKMQDDGSTIDMMVIYTSGARAKIGGEKSIRVRINLAIDITNICYEHSQMIPRMRLVHRQEVAFDETGDDHTDLAMIKNRDDGVLDFVHDLRDKYGADLVCFWNSGGGGTGYAPYDENPGWDAWAFSICGVMGAIARNVMTHESGHNLGLMHDIDPVRRPRIDRDGNVTERGEDAVFTYSYGWRFDNEKFITIMAYPPGVQVWYFSNPNVLFNGVPTGMPKGDPLEADNVSSVNETRLWYTNFRPSVPTPSVPTGVSASDGERIRTKISWQAVAGATHYRVYRSSSPTDIPLEIGWWTSSTEFYDTNVPAHETFYYQVKAAKSNTGSLASSFSQPVSGWRALDIPSHVSATDGEYEDKIEVRWVGDSYRTEGYYRIFRSETLTGTKSPLTGWELNTYTYSDRNVEPHKTYYYWISAAVDANGTHATPYSESDSGWMRMTTPNAHATDGLHDDRVLVTWDLPNGASHYRVFRSETIDGEREPITDWITTTSYSDRSGLSGKIYYYWVRAAQNSYGFDGTGYGREDSGYRAVKTPWILAGDGTDTGGVPLAWENLESHLYYRVMRKDSTSQSTGSYITPWTQDTQFHDVSATPGTSYYYLVKAAVDAQGTRESPLSSYNEGWRKLETPSNVQASDGAYTDKIHVSWDPVWGATHYRVFRADSAGGEKYAQTGYQTNRFIDDRNVQQGETYYYYVSAAINSVGAHASDTSRGNGGSIGLTPPQNVKATDGDTSKVIITWTRLSGTYYYQVYRSDSLQGEKTAITDWVSQALRYEDLNVRAGDIHYYWVRVATSQSGNNASSFSDPDLGYRYLPPPTGVEASDNEYTGKIVVVWDEVVGATHYSISRKASPEGSLAIVGTWQTERIFEDTDVEPGHTYYYQIKAGGSDSGAGLSSYSSANGGFSKMPPPSNVSASNGAVSGSVRVIWQSVAEAFYFRVYRSESIEGEKIVLNDLQRISRFDDTTAEAGKFYYYWVEASRGSTGYGLTDLSDSDVGWLSPPTPGRPTVSNYEYDDKIVVTWNAEHEGIYYRVYRAAEAGGDAEKTPVTQWNKSTLFEDFDVEQGLTYYYYLRAGNDAQGNGASDFGPGYGGARNMPPPENLYAAPGNSTTSIHVTWRQVDNAVYYRLYRSVNLEGERVPLGGWQRQTHLDDTDVMPNTFYYYWVQAARGRTGYGATNDSEPATGWLKPATPKNVSASDGQFLDRVTVTWDAVTPGAFYRLYHSESLEGLKNPIGDWGASISYNYSDAVPGETAYYWVQASLDSTGLGPSDFSLSDTGWRAMEAPQTPSNPIPADGATDVSLTPLLDWADCERAELYNVTLIRPMIPSEQMGKIASEVPDLLDYQGLSESQTILGIELEPGVTYMWQVIGWNRSAQTTGPLWRFTTFEEVDVKDWMIR